ncbi:dihydroneopterin triphosphate diphosphatase [Hydrogenophaga sp. 5NK40-0174]|uniref:dihydroneopterin triphosphate diphosphatase n=1 Tax=Hydrogenophaga sp. 5NK40-0174 TaxID=3127649 RepID=UPI003105746C
MYKIPESVLVVIYTTDLDVLLMERADTAGFWQSVTGSKDWPQESFMCAAAREVREETGIDPLGSAASLQDWYLENVYAIYPAWLHRYEPGVWSNRERVFGLQLPRRVNCRLSPSEHVAQEWLPWLDAADRCYSPSNAEAILLLPRMVRCANT